MATVKISIIAVTTAMRVTVMTTMSVKVPVRDDGDSFW